MKRLCRQEEDELKHLWLSVVCHLLRHKLMSVQRHTFDRKSIFPCSRRDGEVETLQASTRADHVGLQAGQLLGSCVILHAGGFLVNILRLC